MKQASSEKIASQTNAEPALVPDEVTDADQRLYLKLVDTALTPEQCTRIVTPGKIYPLQTSILAIHWHPEHIPVDLIKQRVEAMFPNAEERLIIPTQHNQLNSMDGYAGVEIDCYSKGFNRKVQLLAHFKEERLHGADLFKSMLAHTFTYRSSQLNQFLDTILEESKEDRLQQAAAVTGADADLIEFVRKVTRKVKMLLENNFSITPKEMVRNKLLFFFFDGLRDDLGDRLINRVHIFLREVKRLVKQSFSPRYFYETEQIIEEIRSLGGGIIIPHPEQFWPILLADYDVDGYEVWNPQSREYTDFLINTLNRQNRQRQDGRKPLLVMMGDDCHMGEKAKEPRFQDREKTARELGVQPAWDDLTVRKSLILAGIDRARMIEQYKERLDL
jgi:hypothetical protein